MSLNNPQRQPSSRPIRRRAQSCAAPIAHVTTAVTRNQQPKPKTKQKEKKKNNTKIQSTHPRIHQVQSSSRYIPAAYDNSYVATAPKIKETLNGVHVTHTEMFADVHNSIDFAMGVYNVNPGNAAMFPWLHTIAQGWEHYRFLAITIEYQPVVGTTTPGMVALSPDYNLLEPLPVDMPDLLISPGSTRSQAFRPFSMKADIKKMNAITPWKYIEHLGESHNEPSLYDSFLLQYGTISGQATHLIGNLFVKYTVEMKTPQVDRPLAPANGIYSASTSADSGNHPAGVWNLVETNSVDVDTLGAMDDGTYHIKVNVPIHTDAYTNVGVRSPSEFEVKIEDQDGNIIAEKVMDQGFDENSLGRTYEVVVDTIKLIAKETVLSVFARWQHNSHATTNDNTFRFLKGALMIIRRLSTSGRAPLPALT